jgi:hypothetical protein
MKRLILGSIALVLSGCKFDVGVSDRDLKQQNIQAAQNLVGTSTPMSSHCTRVENGYVYCTTVFVYKPE